MSCPVSLVFDYYTAVKVRTGWYFLAEYHLPFMWHNEWFALVGNPNDRTVLQKLEPYRQRELYSIDYVALPANDDFKARFNELRDRVIGEWSGTRLGTIHNWYDEAIAAMITPNFQNWTDDWLNGRISNLAPYQRYADQYGAEIERSNYGTFPYVERELETVPLQISPSPHRTLMTMESLTTGDISRSTPSVPRVKSNTQISIDAEVRQLIETATSDTPDEAAEHAAIEACKKLKRWLNG